jgi:sodium transport system permease protein
MWRAIFRKEFVEVFGDSRTRFNVIVGPLVITPLVLAMIGSLARSQAAEAQKEQIEVGVVGLRSAPSVAAELQGSKKSGITFVPLASVEEIEQRIRVRKLRAGLVVADDAEERMKNEESAPLTVVDDPGNESSGQAAERLKDFLHQRSDLKAAQRLQEKGLSMQTARPFLIGDRELKGSSRSMLLLTAFLPYILSLSAIMGGLVAASNAVAGEKERGTLETLLVTPVTRQNIALGKFLTVTATALISCTLSMVGMLWPFYVKLPMFAWMASQGLNFKPVAIVALVLVQIPLSVFGAGLLLALSTYAKNQKEMQAFTVPVVLLGTVGAMLSLLLKTEAPLYWALVPITNAALVLKQALQGIIDPPFIAIACGTSLLYASAAVLLAAQLFRRESVLTRF